ncbi:MAG: glucosidase [Verrucomicrobiota bacterium]
MATDPESIRIQRDPVERTNWKLWGPYLSERQWGTVREDYSADSDAWGSFPREHAPSRAYRWGEDGLMGWSDRQCRLCFSISMWNGNDSQLKERLFGLTNHEGNHGEDVKELYYYVDSTPTHSFARSLYKYPQKAFPYEDLIRTNRDRNRIEPEYELEDTGILDLEEYFDVETTYAKDSPEDLLIVIRVTNRAAKPAPIHLLPTIWFRNTWSWGRKGEDMTSKPSIVGKDGHLFTEHETLPSYRFAVEGETDFWFTDNETNPALWDKPHKGADHRYKDAFNQALLRSETEALCPEPVGTKACAVLHRVIEGGETIEWRCRLTRASEKMELPNPFGPSFDKALSQRKEEADLFYEAVCPPHLSLEERTIVRQSFAGLLWTKQFYHFIVNDWLDGDPDNPAPSQRKKGRNSDWNHLFNRDVVSMPDKWEYPWYAAWDLAFHTLPIAEVDPHFAKRQLSLFLREWYMHPNGQLPAYEWNFSDVNPPVHAWAVWRVYKIAAERGDRDLPFLASSFQKLLMNFTWWVNRKDPNGDNLFSGGFLGLDNIGVFDRSHGLPVGATLEQADGTGWMAFYCTTMLAMAIELAEHDKAYEDLASKFFEHFVTITLAINGHGRHDGLWCEEEGFYYDWLSKDGVRRPLAVRSLVGLLPLVAVEILDQHRLEKLPGFNERTNWFLEHRSHLADSVSSLDENGERRLLSCCSKERLKGILAYLFDEDEFLSPYGIRSLSKYHEQHPFSVDFGDGPHSITYTPGESDSPMFGGNSNWRGPIWFPTNYLLIEALERYHHFYGDDFKVEFPTGSGDFVTLQEAAVRIGQRLISIFSTDEKTGKRPANGRSRIHHSDRPEADLIHFYEYFHADTGEGLGASHQTGWTSLVSRLAFKAGRKK